MFIKLECTIGNEEMNDVGGVEYYTRPIASKFEVVDRIKKHYGKRLIRIDCLDVDPKINSDYSGTPFGATGVYGTYYFNTVND